MKNNYIIIALLLVVAHFNVNAQLSLTHTSKKKGLSINEFDLEEDPIWFINALEAENVCDCSENISFNYDSFITSAFLMERAMKAARKEWLSRQENLVNEEIEKAFNTDFPNYREARKRLLKHQESTIVDHTIVGVKDKYITKRNQKRNYQETLLKEIKLLNFREEELRRGVISSKYGHLKLGAIPIKDLNLNAVLNEKRNRLSAFTTNNIALKKEGNIANELAKINNLPSGELNHGIFELLYAKQNEYFSKYNDWEQLNLTYVYLLNFLHPTRGPEIPNSITVNGKVLYQQFFGRADFLEHLAINNYGGNVSADNVSALLETISIDDMLADTAVKNLGQRNVDFLKSRPKLLSEIREYFKVNDFSKISHDCVNYLLNQLQDGNSFAPNTNLYQSSGAALLQNVSNPNRALSFNLNDQAIKEGFTNFGNVLSELFADGENVGYEGYIIRNIFIKNGIYIPNHLSNNWLGVVFNFDNISKGKTIRINYLNNLGYDLLSLNILMNNFLNNINRLPEVLLQQKRPNYFGQVVRNPVGSASRIHENAVAVLDSNGATIAFVTPDEKVFFWTKTSSAEGYFNNTDNFSYKNSYFFYVEDKYMRLQEPISWGIHRSADDLGGFIVDLVGHPNKTISDFAKGMLKIITLDFDLEKTWNSIINADLSDASYVVATLALGHLAGPKGKGLIPASETPQFQELLAQYAAKAKPGRLTWPELLQLFKKARAFEELIDGHLKTIYKISDGYSVFNQVYLKYNGVVSIVDNLIYNNKTRQFILNETKYGIHNVLTKNQKYIQDAIKAGKKIEVRTRKELKDINGNIIAEVGDLINITEILRGHSINGVIDLNTLKTLWKK
ncbi:hypothetical protein [Tenacibaculum maritimum]|uniref:hypothetical protein n=1 Tax=Tenacibaculum maritimum TaxID=107401 RepID=UPI00387782F2